MHPGQWEQGVADWAKANGIDPRLAVATVYGESSGYGSAVNRGDPNGGSYGIFQINGVHIAGMGGDWNVDPAKINDPAYILGQTPEGAQWKQTEQTMLTTSDWWAQVRQRYGAIGDGPLQLAYFWKQGQGSVWPTKQQLTDALAQADAALSRGFWS